MLVRAKNQKYLTLSNTLLMHICYVIANWYVVFNIDKIEEQYYYLLYTNILLYNI